MNTEEMPRYRKCRHYVPGSFSDFKTGHKYFCAPYAKTLGEQWKQKHEINIEECEKCNKYESRFIEYPLTIEGIEIKNPEAWGISFEPVKVRLCEDGKTYFGILLGEFPWHTAVEFDRTNYKGRNPYIINTQYMDGNICYT